MGDASYEKKLRVVVGMDTASMHSDRRLVLDRDEGQAIFEERITN